METENTFPGFIVGFSDAETRRLRKQAHEVFDAMWSSGRMSRNAAYRWMAEAMKLPKDEAHIGMFTADQCLKLINLVEMRHFIDAWELFVNKEME